MWAKYKRNHVSFISIAPTSLECDAKGNPTIGFSWTHISHVKVASPTLSRNSLCQSLLNLSFSLASLLAILFINKMSRALLAISAGLVKDAK